MNDTMADFSDPLSAKKPHLTQTEARANKKYQNLMSASPARQENDLEQLEIYDKIKGLKKTDNKTL